MCLKIFSCCIAKNTNNYENSYRPEIETASEFINSSDAVETRSVVVIQPSVAENKFMEEKIFHGSIGSRSGGSSFAMERREIIHEITFDHQPTTSRTTVVETQETKQVGYQFK